MEQETRIEKTPLQLKAAKDQLAPEDRDKPVFGTINRAVLEQSLGRKGAENEQQLGTISAGSGGLCICSGESAVLKVQAPSLRSFDEGHAF